MKNYVVRIMRTGFIIHSLMFATYEEAITYCLQLPSGTQYRIERM